MIGFFDFVIIAFALFALSRAVLRFRDKAINSRQLLFWIIVWGLVIVLIILRDRLSFLTQLGVTQRPIDLVVYSALIILFYTLFRLYVKIDQIERGFTKVVRELATKEKPAEVEKMEEPGT